MYKYAEVNKVNHIIHYIGQAPFLPDFGAAGLFYVVDVTAISAAKEGMIWNGTGVEPAPEPEPIPDPYLGTLTLNIISGGVFDAVASELNATIGRSVTATGHITDAGGNTLPVDMPLLRLPVLPTDLNGNTLTTAQPSLAVASIAQGVVNATWTPEFTGTYVITEDAINIRLPEGAKLHFNGLAIFVLPSMS
jgi:hypothetical protein